MSSSLAAMARGGEEVEGVFLIGGGGEKLSTFVDEDVDDDNSPALLFLFCKEGFSTIHSNRSRRGGAGEGVYPVGSTVERRPPH